VPLIDEDGYPRWWPTLVSATGLGLSCFIVIQRVNLPWFDPVLVALIFTGPAEWFTRRRRPTGEDDR
jgi:hypothetical protein